MTTRRSILKSALALAGVGAVAPVVKSNPYVYGIDPAYGRDRTVITVVEWEPILRRIRFMPDPIIIHPPVKP